MVCRHRFPCGKNELCTGQSDYIIIIMNIMSMYFHYVISSFEYNGYNIVNAALVSNVVDRSIVFSPK